MIVPALYEHKIAIRGSACLSNFRLVQRAPSLGNHVPRQEQCRLPRGGQNSFGLSCGRGPVAPVKCGLALQTDRRFRGKAGAEFDRLRSCGNCKPRCAGGQCAGWGWNRCERACRQPVRSRIEAGFSSSQLRLAERGLLRKAREGAETENQGRKADPAIVESAEGGNSN
jgi:hypothetical protein